MSSKIDQDIADLVNSPAFFQEFKESLQSIRDPEKKVKIMDSLLGYQMSKYKTVEPVAENRFRPIEIHYTVAGVETSISNGYQVEDAETPSEAAETPDTE